MSLQVRLRHALGERLVDLPDRPAEKPLVVGRAGNADIKIPSVTVGNEHCALFVHEGQWVIQDMSGGATFVNNEQALDPTPLNVGDIIVLGGDSNPATIEIDPAGVAQGRTGHPAESRMPPPPLGRSTPQPQSRPGMRSIAGAPVAMPPQIVVPPQPASDDPWGSQETGQDDAFAGWSQPASDASPTTMPIRKKAANNSSETGLIVGIGACVLIIGGTIWFAMTHLHPAVDTSPKKAVVIDDTDKGPKNIFTNSGFESSSPAAKSVASSGTPVTSRRPVPKPEETEAPASPDDANPTDTPAATHNPAAPASTDADPHKGDETWVEIEGAHFSPVYGLAILKFDDYRRQHPGAFQKELDAYAAEAMDRLWCQRLSQLCAKRSSLNKQIREKDAEIRQESSVAFKKTLTTEKSVLDRDLKLAEEHLTGEMGYGGDDVPDATHPEVIAKLIAERDPTKFAAWKLRTLNFIRTKHGSLPWDGE